MKKADLLNEQYTLLDWVQGLQKLEEKVWYQPFSEGKWATADVISHFITWDRFLLEHRIPYIRKGLSFPKLDINAEKLNKDASVYARSGISKEQLIHEYNQTKKMVIAELEELSEEIYNSVIKIGKSEKSVSYYFESHLQHDQKHVQQLLRFVGDK